MLSFALDWRPGRWAFACRLKGEEKIRSCKFYTGPWGNRNLFKALAHAIQHHFHHGKAPYPVERLGMWSFLLVPADDWRTLVLGSICRSRPTSGMPVP